MTVSSDIKVKLIYSALSIFFLPHSFFIHLMKGIWNSRPEKYLYPLEIIGTLNSDCPLSLILSIVLGRCKIVSASSLSQKCSKLDTISIFFSSKFKGRDIQFQNQGVHLSRVHRIKLLSNSSSILVFSQNSSTLHSHFHRCIFSVCISTGLSIFVRVVAYP